MLSHSFTRAKGKVYLVGAGPGHPDLLTVRAVRILRLATVVLHDALVSQEVLALISPQAKVVNVGKRCGHKKVSQDEINGLLIQYASCGQIVVRLKSGDPSVFGRGGEELDVLKHAGIEIEIVPGITAALAAAASVKVSLTDRRKADHLVVVSAHRTYGKDDREWTTLLNQRSTLVIYMPGDCSSVAAVLVQAGLKGSTPCAIVSKVSTPEEQWYSTRLDLLHRIPRLPAPCILIVGETLTTVTSKEVRHPHTNSVEGSEASNFQDRFVAFDDGSAV